MMAKVYGCLDGFTHNGIKYQVCGEHTDTTRRLCGICRCGNRYSLEGQVMCDLYYGNGSDGACVISKNTTLPARTYNFESLTICPDVKVDFSGGTAVPIIKAQKFVCNLGTIDLRSCDCIYGCCCTFLLTGTIGNKATKCKLAWTPIGGAACTGAGKGGDYGKNGCKATVCNCGSGGTSCCCNGGGGGGTSTAGTNATTTKGGDGGTGYYCCAGGGGGFGICGGNGGAGTSCCYGGYGGGGGNGCVDGGNGGSGNTAGGKGGDAITGKGGDGGYGGHACSAGTGGCGGFSIRGTGGNGGGARTRTSSGGKGGDTMYGVGGNGGGATFSGSSGNTVWASGGVGGNATGGQYGLMVISPCVYNTCIIGCGGKGGNGGNGYGGYCCGTAYNNNSYAGGNGGYGGMGADISIFYECDITCGTICNKGGCGGTGAVMAWGCGCWTKEVRAPSGANGTNGVLKVCKLSLS